MSAFKSNYQRTFFTFIMVIVMALSHIILSDRSAPADLAGDKPSAEISAEILTAAIEMGPERELHTRDENGGIATPDLFALSADEAGVGIDKRIVELNRETGEVTVELALQGVAVKPEAMYVTLLLDCSNSMDKYLTGTTVKKLASMKIAAKELINSILSDEANPENKLSIVIFSNNAVIQTFGGKMWAGVNAADRTAALKIVDSLTQQSLALGTNTQGAFHETYKIFNDEETKSPIETIRATGQNVNQYTLLISDGKPTVCYPPSQGGPYYLASDTTRTNAVKDAHNRNETFLQYFKAGPYTYGKLNKNAEIRRDAKGAITFTNNYDNAIFSGDGNTANGANLVASAVYEADRVKDLGVKIFALGIDLGGEAEDDLGDGSATVADQEKVERAKATMEGVKSDGTHVYYADSPDGLNQVRTQIFSEMQIFSVPASIQDIIGDEFEFVGLLDDYNSLNVNGTIRYDEGTRTIYWNGAVSGELQTIRYKLIIKDNAPEGSLDTNESAYLEYENKSNGKTVNMAFPKPTVNNAILSVGKELYKLDGLTRAAGNEAEFTITVKGVDPAKLKPDTNLYKDGDVQYYRFLSLSSEVTYEITLEESSLPPKYKFIEVIVGDKTFSQPLTEQISIGANDFVNAVYKNIEVEQPLFIEVEKTIQDMGGNWVKNAQVQDYDEFTAKFTIQNIGAEPLTNINLTNRYGIADDGDLQEGLSNEHSFSITFPTDFAGQPGQGEELIVMINDNGVTEYAVLDYENQEHSMVNNISIIFPSDFNGTLEPGEELIIMVTLNGLAYGAAYSDTVTVTAERGPGGNKVTDQDTATAETNPATPSSDPITPPDPYTPKYSYIVEYYVDDDKPENLIGKENGISEFDPGHRLTEDEVTIDLGEDWIKSKEPPDYLYDTESYTVITTIVEDNIVKVIYTKPQPLINPEIYPYVVEYYKDSVASENMLGSVPGMSEFEDGHALTVADVQDDLGEGWLDAFMADGYGHGAIQGGLPIISVIVENNIVIVLYTSTQADSPLYPYSVEYYADEVTPANMIGDPITSGVYYPEGYLLAEADLARDIGENWLNARQPENYDSGVVQESLPVITTEPANNVVRILYTSHYDSNDNVEYPDDPSPDDPSPDDPSPNDPSPDSSSLDSPSLDSPSPNGSSSDSSSPDGSNLDRSSPDGRSLEGVALSSDSSGGSESFGGSGLNSGHQTFSDSSYDEYEATYNSDYQTGTAKTNPKTTGDNMNVVIYTLITCSILALMALIWKKQIARKL